MTAKDNGNNTGSAETHIRAFIAIELPTALKDGLTEIQETFRATIKDGISWARPETMHLTIKFLGSIDASRINEVSAAIEDAASKIAPFELTAKGLGAFPSKKRPSTIWVGIEDSPELERLHERIESRLEAIGFPREKKGLRPHLTLARVRRGRSEIKKSIAHALSTFETKLSDSFTVRELVLFESELRKVGALHTPIKRFNFRD